MFFFIFITICVFLYYKLLPKTPTNKWSVQETKENIPSMTKEQCQTYQLSHVPFSQICFIMFSLTQKVGTRTMQNMIFS